MDFGLYDLRTHQLFAAKHFSKESTDHILLSFIQQLYYISFVFHFLVFGTAVRYELLCFIACGHAGRAVSVQQMAPWFSTSNMDTMMISPRVVQCNPGLVSVNINTRGSPRHGIKHRSSHVVCWSYFPFLVFVSLNRCLSAFCDFLTVLSSFSFGYQGLRLAHPPRNVDGSRST